jgi:hypothetical protein
MRDDFLKMRAIVLPRGLTILPLEAEIPIEL